MGNYFNNWQAIPFKTPDPQAPVSADLKYSPAIAWWLAQCSSLSYETKMVVARELKAAKFEKVVFFDAVGSQAFLAIHPGNGGGKFAVLAFRGTEQDSVDILTDIKFFRRVFPNENLLESSEPTPPKRKKPLYVHAGFLEGLQNVWGTGLRAEVKDAFPDKSSAWYGAPGVSDAICEVGAHIPLYFTGHSLGGALATIAIYKALVYTDRINIAGLYTFGSPRTVQEELADRISSEPLLKGKLYRVVNHNDVVARVPIHLPPFFEYKHIDQLIYYNENNQRRKKRINGGRILWMDTKVLLLTLLEIGLWFVTFHRYTPKTIECHMISKYIEDVEEDLNRIAKARSRQSD